MVEERLRDRMELEKERMREYKMELEKMEARVMKRPTLFQRQSKVRRGKLFEATILKGGPDEQSC